MATYWMCNEPSPSLWKFLVQGIGDVHRFGEMTAGHRFGDMTVTGLRSGEIWRLITCNFVHYSVAHIALNLLAFYLLGTLD